MSNSEFKICNSIIIYMSNEDPKIGEKSIFCLGNIINYSRLCSVGQIILNKIGYDTFVLDIIKKDGNTLTIYNVFDDKEYTLELTDKENKKVSNYELYGIYDNLEKAIKDSKEMLNN